MINEELILLSLDDLKRCVKKNYNGVLFCFGKSFISQIIMAKTRKDKDEIVPSHVAMIVDGTYLYESTSAEEKVGNKTIPAGVRRYLLSDFYKAEKNKGTMYFLYDIDLPKDKLEKYIHLPYGKDIILDFVLRDGSDGTSKGLICSQYANLVAGILPQIKCPSPAQLYRKVCTDTEEFNIYYE